MELYLLRHGQSESNARLTDHLDSELTNLGKEQSIRAANRLSGEGITALYTSPLRRTLQTAAAACELTGVPAFAYPDICEYMSVPAYATFPGMGKEAICREFPHAEFSDDIPFTDTWWPQVIEDRLEIARRSERVRETLLDRYGNTNARIVLVSHADTIGRIIESFLRVPPSLERPPWSENAAITRLTINSTEPKPADLIYLNDVRHLDGMRSA